MPYAWFENNNIFIKDNRDLIPDTAIEIPAGTTPQDLKIVDGKLMLKDINEKLNEIKQFKLTVLKQNLANKLSTTDYIITKLQSMRDEGFSDEEIDQEKEKYTDIFEQRRLLRITYNKIKNQIINAKSINELNAITNINLE